jgi:hypothetical protein
MFAVLSLGRDAEADKPPKVMVPESVVFVFV